MLRLKLIFALFVGGLLLICLRLVYLQVLLHSKYEVLAKQQYFIVHNVPAPRGQIFSSDGYLLVGNETKYLLYAEPKEITLAPQDLAEKLMPILYADLYEPAPYLRNITKIMTAEEELVAALGRQDLYWVALKHHLSTEAKKQIESQNLSGLGFEEESVRFYPQGSLARELLGVVGQNTLGESVGYFGVEGYYNGDLQGRQGNIFQEQNAWGQPILVGEYSETPALPGKDLNLTINRSLQYLVEKNLTAGLTKYGAEAGTAVIIEPATGAILAMSSVLAANRSEASSSGALRNLAVDSSYEPGSVMKPLTVAAALESRVIKPEDIYNDVGPVSYSGHLVDNWDRKHHGPITITQILELSNNNGAAWVGTKLGAVGLRDYLLRFGVGNTLNIDLQGETGGIIKSTSDWLDIDTATASFGQGLATTPLQVASVYATIANGGILVRPHVLQTATTIIRRVVSLETAGTLTKMLTSAVANGESKYYNLRNYTIAGKTGTAQIAVNGTYDPQKSNTTFVGFLPKMPRFVMLIKLEKPTTSIYAAETAVPLWMDLAREVVVELGLPPDK